jgi:hypothetical protein
MLVTYLLTFLPIYLRICHKQVGYKCRVKPHNECFTGPPDGTQRQESQVFVKLPSVGLFHTASKAWGVAF